MHLQRHLDLNATTCTLCLGFDCVECIVVRLTRVVFTSASNHKQISKLCIVMIIKSLSAVESELLGEYTYSHSSYWRGGSFLEAQSSEELAFYVPSYNL